MDLGVSNKMLLGIIQSAMDAIITIDAGQRIMLFNAAAEKIFGCPAQEAIGASIDRFIPARFRDAHRQHVEQFGQAGTTVRRMGGNLVLSGLRADGKEFPIEASISYADAEGSRLYTVILRDVTERQRAASELAQSHVRLRDLYEQMHEVREAERTRIARELHDELAQWLTALKMDAAAVSGRLAAEDPLKPRVERMKKVVDTTVASVRRIAADLRPVMLDDLGVGAAIESLLHDLRDRTGLAVMLQNETGDLMLEEPHATAVYRMVQEALTNVVRHAAATRMEVRISASDGRLNVRVCDDGRGIAPNALSATKSFGVLGIRERARTLGGESTIYSPPEGGTIVEIALPLPTKTDKGRRA
jgi:PAS domain S-box-containing protein